jgi:type V secretory pathway adhesin AidA
MNRFAALSLIALAACSGRDSRKPDSALATDLALASQAQAIQPQFQDTAASPAQPQRAPTRIDAAPRTRPVTRQPAPTQTSTPAPAAAPEAQRVIGAGSSFSLASQQRVCTQSNRPGDRFVATLTSPVTGSNGAVIPAGSSIVLEVVAMDAGTNNGADGSMRLAVRSIDFGGNSYQVNANAFTNGELEQTRIMGDPNADKKKVIGGAVIGGILGQVIGHNTKGTVIGAAAGAATGAVAAKATQKFEACLPVGGPLRMTLSSALVL